jgi:hypothetical protein
MYLGLKNYAVIMTIEKSCIKFNKKINSLQRYDSARNYIILHRVVQCFSQHNPNLSRRRHIKKLRQRK